MNATEAWRRYKTQGDQDAREWLIKHFSWMADKYTNTWCDSLAHLCEKGDLRSAMYEGLIVAVDTYDLERGTKFITHCIWRFRATLRDLCRRMDNVPVYIRKQISDGQFEEMKYLQMSHPLVSKAVAALPNDEIDVVSQTIGAIDNDAVRAAVMSLPDRERDVIVRYYWHEERMADIGIDLNVSMQRGCQIRDIALGRLAQSLEGVMA